MDTVNAEALRQQVINQRIARDMARGSIAAGEASKAFEQLAEAFGALSAQLAANEPMMQAAMERFAPPKP